MQFLLMASPLNLRPEPLLARPVLDVGSPQPRGHRGVPLPPQRQVVELRGLVVQKSVPANIEPRRLAGAVTKADRQRGR